MATKAGEPTTIVINALITLTYASILLVFMPKLRKLQ
jgi:hypothetical protein